MRALTLWQPWASLVAIGAKQWETRSWGTSYRGPLLIHAAMRNPPKIDNPLVFEEMIQALGVADFAELPRGAVLAVVDLTGIWKLIPPGPTELPICPSCLNREMLLGDWANLRHVWRLRGGFRLRVPVHAAGKRGLWRPNAAIVTTIKSQIGVYAQRRPTAPCEP